MKIIWLSLICIIFPAVAGYFSVDKTADVMAAFSQYLGVVGLLGMACCTILATRWRLLEKLFNGLDKSYWIHKWLGIISLAVILLHDSIDADMPGDKSGWLADLGETMGENSYNILLALLFISVVTIIPYALWKFTHKFMSLVFVLAFAHYLMIDKFFTLSSSLGLYVIVIGSLGSLACLYILLLPKSMKRPYAYKVSKVEKIADVVAVTLSTDSEESRKNKALPYTAGQFAFIQFEHPNLKETHPFTISQAPQESGDIRFSIKSLGDDTKHMLESIKVGVNATVSRGHGYFGHGQDKRPQVWVAAGIGITPFVAMAQSRSSQAPKITLIYAVKNAGNAPHLSELQEIAEHDSHFELVLIESDNNNRFAPEQLQSYVEEPLKECDLRFCGPVVLRQRLQKLLPTFGISARHFHFERFEIRSGIGITPVVSFILARLLRQFPWLQRVWQQLDQRLISRLGD